MYTLHTGNSLDILKTIQENSIDSIVTDPPYELGFMGKSWDKTGIANNVELWKECLRVLKPGGHLLAFSGTRTYHRMAVAIEDAGFEVRDMIEWVYGSGFPKSLNIGKAVDKLQGNEREVIGNEQKAKPTFHSQNVGQEITKIDNIQITKGTSEWEGWGTAMKPSHEPICMARKPLAEKTVAENCLKYGTGGINIDESRVGTEGGGTSCNNREVDGNCLGHNNAGKSTSGETIHAKETSEVMGRFPANLIHDNSEEVTECFPESNGRFGAVNTGKVKFSPADYGKGQKDTGGIKDSGNASRFFKSIIYQGKASKSERNKGLDRYLTVKYNGVITDNNKTLCKEENMVAVQLLRKVMSDMEAMNFNTDESGVNIMVQCHKDSLYTISMKIKQIIESKTYNWLMHLLTNEYTQVANSEMEIGGNLVIPAEKQKELMSIIGIYQKRAGFNMGNVKNAILSVLSLISVEENWKPKTNIHSTVKPITLMEYLVKMVTKKGGTVLDPFNGSGSTGVACVKNGYNYIGIDLSQDYIQITELRIKSHARA